jgi:hypothetical protein
VVALVGTLLLAGCSVHVGYGDPNEIATENAYRSAIAPAASALTAASQSSDADCAGGSHPDQRRCYDDTVAEITSARELQHILTTIHTPKRFAAANDGIVRGLAPYIQGLTLRNQALRDHSGDEYRAGLKLIDRGVAIQKQAFGLYPADAHISA